MKVGDWEATIKNLNRETTQDFFLYVCERSKITSWSITEEYIRQFQQLYTTVNGQYMDWNKAKEVYKVGVILISVCRYSSLVVRPEV